MKVTFSLVEPRAAPARPRLGEVDVVSFLSWSISICRAATLRRRQPSYRAGSVGRARSSSPQPTLRRPKTPVPPAGGALLQPRGPRAAASASPWMTSCSQCETSGVLSPPRARSPRRAPACATGHVRRRSRFVGSTPIRYASSFLPFPFRRRTLFVHGCTTARDAVDAEHRRGEQRPAREPGDAVLVHGAVEARVGVRLGDVRELAVSATAPTMPTPKGRRTVTIALFVPCAARVQSVWFS